MSSAQRVCEYSESERISMAFQLLVNGALAIFFTYCFFFIGMTAPPSNPTNMDAAQWPQVILFLLVALLCVNMYQIYKKTPANKRNFNIMGNTTVVEFLKSKLVMGIVFIALFALALEPLGFMLSTFIFSFAYQWLLGEKRPARLAIVAFVATIVIYLIFQRALGIMLPRGYGFLRDFALMLESI